MGKPAPNWRFSAACGGNTGPSLPLRSQKAYGSPPPESRPQIGTKQPRANINGSTSIPRSGVHAVAVRPHHNSAALCAVTKPLRRAVGGFYGLQRSACRFCHPGRFLRPLRWLAPLMYSESPSLAADRRPPSGISRRRRLPYGVGEWVFGFAKKGRGLCLRRRIRRYTTCPQGSQRASFRKPSPQGCVSLGLFKISI